MSRFAIPMRRCAVAEAVLCLMLAPATGFAQQATAQAPASAASGASSSGEVKQLEAVTVTASKRKERQQDAPLAMSALSSDTIEKLGVEQFSNYVGLIPNLAQVGGSGNGIGTVVLRGMYTGSQQLTNTTGFYLGETPFSASGSLSAAALVTPDPDLVNVERIEVLKGPQGTLFGASSLGGLIRIIPKSADVKNFGFDARLGANSAAGGGNGYGARASINVPVVTDRLGLLATVFDREDPGYTKNSKTGSDEQGKLKASGGSLALRAAVTPELDLTARALTQRLKSFGAAAQDNLLGTSTPTTGVRQFATRFDQTTNAQYDLGEVSAEWRAPLGTLTATLSNGTSSTAGTFDYTAIYGPVITLFAPPGLIAPTFKLPGPLKIQTDKSTAEVRFASRRLGAFEFLIGGFSTRENNEYDLAILGQNAAGAALPSVFSNVVTSKTSSKYKENAIFGNTTYYLTDALDVGVGVRYAKNDQTASLTGSGLLSTSPGTNSIASSDSKTTYQGTLRWRPAADLSTYARVATGYRPGGAQTNASPPPGVPPTYDPDTVTNYELGAKGRTLNGRFSYDVSIYHIDWKNIQLNALAGGKLIVGNAGKATVDGSELQLAYLATDELSLGASFGYNNATIKEVGATTASFIGAVNGDRLPGSPKVTAALFGDYRFPQAGIFTPTAGATVKYQGSKLSAFSNDPLNPRFTEEAYTLIDLRASLEWKQFTLRLSVDNVTNKNGFTSYSTSRLFATQVVSSVASLVRPRTFGLTFSVAM